MSKTTNVLVEKQKRYQHFSDERKIPYLFLCNSPVSGTEYLQYHIFEFIGVQPLL